MLMGHPPQIIARRRENASQSRFEGLTPVQVAMVVQELVVCDAEVQETLADPLETVQEVAQARPDAFHRIAVNTHAIGVMASILACAMVDRAVVIISLGEIVDVVFIGEELRPDFHLGRDDGFDRGGTHILQDFQIDLSGWRILVLLVAALHQTQEGWTACLGRGATAKLNSAWSGFAFAPFDFAGQAFAACTLVTFIGLHLVRQLAAGVQMIGFVEATVQQIDASLCRPLLEVSRRRNFRGVQLQLPEAYHQQPFDRTQLALLEDRTGPIRKHGKVLAQTCGTTPTVETLQPVVAAFAWLDGMTSAAGTLDAIGPAQLSQVVSGFAVILQMRDQVFHRVAPMRFRQPHYTQLVRRSRYNALLLKSVDGYNLYYGLREKRWKWFYWLNIQTMARRLLKSNQTLVTTKYFTTIVKHPEDRRVRQAVYLESLRTLDNIQIFFGHFLSEVVTCHRCGHTHETHHEKMTDVNIAVELMTDAFQDWFDVALLVSADSDLIGPIQAVQRLFPHKRVVVAFPPARFSSALSQTAHAYIHIGRNVLSKSVFPEQIAKPGGYLLSRPAEWR
jgi:uncharacterized LabA/DUF88 family protein